MSRTFFRHFRAIVDEGTLGTTHRTIFTKEEGQNLGGEVMEKSKYYMYLMNGNYFSVTKRVA